MSYPVVVVWHVLRLIFAYSFYGACWWMSFLVHYPVIPIAIAVGCLIKLHKSHYAESVQLAALMAEDINEIRANIDGLRKELKKQEEGFAKLVLEASGQFDKLHAVEQEVDRIDETLEGRYPL